MSAYSISDTESESGGESVQGTPSTHPGVDRVRESITGKTYCAGTRSIAFESSILYYGGLNDTIARRLNLSEATNDQLSDLNKACKPASFGRDNEDVLDESYRKAGKLDLTDFATTFSLSDTNIMDIVKSELVEGKDEIEKVVRAELYKLNVYDEGSFFKAHKDTPRAANMFASLVIVFATPHEGGALLLRHKNKEWTFDSAKEVAGSKSSVGFIAFYSDVEHEVTPVTSGYRVTLTYNLYLDAKKPYSEVVVSNAGSAAGITSSTHTTMKVALEELLADSSFLPNGGRIGFGLSHQYPLSKPKARDHKKNPLEDLITGLKGSDATVYSTCNAMSLEAGLRIIYEDEDEDEEWHVMMDHVVDYGDRMVDDGEHIVEYMKRDGGEVIWVDGYLEDHYGDQVVPVQWITPPTPFNQVEASYMAYGNEASQAQFYGDLCLIVKVGAFGARATANISKEKVVTDKMATVQDQLHKRADAGTRKGSSTLPLVKTLAEVDGLTVAKLDEQLDILRQMDQMVPLKSKCGNKKERGEKLKEALKRYWKATTDA